MDKTSKKLAKETLRNETKIKDLLRAVARDPDFKDYALLYSTGSSVCGLLITIFIKSHLSDQIETISNKIDHMDQKIEDITAAKSLDSEDEEGIERFSNKIVESFKKQGLIPQEGEIKTDIVESSVSSGNELEEQNKQLKKNCMIKITQFVTFVSNKWVSLV